MKQLATLLAEGNVGLAEHAPAFEKAGIDMDDLMSMDWESSTKPEQAVSFDVALLVSLCVHRYSHCCG